MVVIRGRQKKVRRRMAPPIRFRRTTGASGHLEVSWKHLAPLSLRAPVSPIPVLFPVANRRPGRIKSPLVCHPLSPRSISHALLVQFLLSLVSHPSSHPLTLFSHRRILCCPTTVVTAKVHNGRTTGSTDSVVTWQSAYPRSCLEYRVVESAPANGPRVPLTNYHCTACPWSS